MSQDQYNTPSFFFFFVPVHTLATHPVPLLFIYISAWMGERRTLRERESIKEPLRQQMPALFGFGSPEIFGIGTDDVNISGVICFSTSELMGAF